jgi:hypothetical protein
MHRKDLNNKNKVYNITKSYITFETNLPCRLYFRITFTKSILINVYV